jgi:hypothetical protein
VLPPRGSRYGFFFVESARLVESARSESARSESAWVIGVVLLMPAMELSVVPELVVVVVVAGAMLVLSAAPLSDLLQAPRAAIVTRAVIAVIALVRISLLWCSVDGSSRILPVGPELAARRRNADSGANRAP